MSVNAPAASAAAAATGGIPLQDASIDVTKLDALSPEVISRQATVSILSSPCLDTDILGLTEGQINVGTIGHVAHGKSSTVRAVSGVTTIRFKNELERNITIKLGYANAKVS